MPITVIELYRDVLPKTNCGDCGQPACFAFATRVIVEKEPLGRCPHIESGLLVRYETRLAEQRSGGTSVKKDVASDAREWARERGASMKFEDLPGRIGGRLIETDGGTALELPYFTDAIVVTRDTVRKKTGEELGHYQQVFIFNHIAMGGNAVPTGKWVSLKEVPHSGPKLRSMKAHVEDHLVRRFSGKLEELAAEAAAIGGEPVSDYENSADSAFLFRPLPRVPVMLLFWDGDPVDGFDAEARFLFDDTINQHLDIESIMFLCELIRELLCGEEEK